MMNNRVVSRRVHCADLQKRGDALCNITSAEVRVSKSDGVRSDCQSNLIVPDGVSLWTGPSVRTRCSDADTKLLMIR